MAVIARRSGVARALRPTSQSAALNTSGPDATGAGTVVEPGARGAVSRVATVLIPSAGRRRDLHTRRVQRAGGDECADLARRKRSETDVVVLDRQGVDADRRRGDPAGELTGLVVRHHQPGDAGPVLGGRQVVAGRLLPGGLVDDLAGGRDVLPGEGADLAVEALVRQEQPLLEAGLLQLLVPPPDTVLAVGGVLVAQVEVERVEHRHRAGGQLPVLDDRDLHRQVVQLVVVLAAGLHPAPLEAGGVVGRDVGRR